MYNSSNNFISSLPQEIQPTSAWLFNCIANKHADAMDNYPEPAILPREESDKQEAEALTSILPLILEQNEFEETYSDAWWYKLKSGTAVYGIFWNPKKLNGLGDIEIKPIDLLNLFWEPGIKNIQDSRNLFNIAKIIFITLITDKPTVSPQPAVTKPDGIIAIFGQRFFAPRLPYPITKCRNSENNC